MRGAFPFPEDPEDGPGPADTKRRGHWPAQGRVQSLDLAYHVGSPQPSAAGQTDPIPVAIRVFGILGVRQASFPAIADAPAAAGIAHQEGVPLDAAHETRLWVVSSVEERPTIHVHTHVAGYRFLPLVGAHVIHFDVLRSAEGLKRCSRRGHM